MIVAKKILKIKRNLPYIPPLAKAHTIAPLLAKATLKDQLWSQCLQNAALCCKRGRVAGKSGGHGRAHFGGSRSDCLAILAGLAGACKHHRGHCAQEAVRGIQAQSARHAVHPWPAAL